MFLFVSRFKPSYVNPSYFVWEKKCLGYIFWMKKKIIIFFKHGLICGSKAWFSASNSWFVNISQTKLFKPLSVHEPTHQMQTYREREKNHGTVPLDKSLQSTLFPNPGGCPELDRQIDIVRVQSCVYYMILACILIFHEDLKKLLNNIVCRKSKASPVDNSPSTN